MSTRGCIWRLVFAMGFLMSALTHAAERPSLALTKAGVERMRAELGSVPLFDASVAMARTEVDAEIEMGIDTPLPRDFSGGYTHERHKRNFFVLQKAGALYQILADEKYAEYVRAMLFQYEAMYQDLPLHPQTRSYARGKLFWQCLNDANWLVYMSQAYDAVYEWLSEADRERLEANLFRPFADHISIDSPQFFNRVHNHSTWGAAAVGMIALVMEDDALLARALHGLENDGLAAGAKDDDGGFIKVAGQDAGFFANLEVPFSPDGYYTEGPYYQRYAMYPFLIFAQALNNTRPELGIFEYKDGVLLKGVHALLQLTDADGEFFPINDAQKGMSYLSRELVTAVNIAYFVGGQDPGLLDIAEKQGRVALSDAGFAVAAALRDGKSQPFEKTSVNFSDGADGSQGGLAVLRHGDEDLSLVFKYAAQGLSHGHYDKLSFSLFQRGDEILQDYGLVRFVNIEQKGGGNYLKENTTWAKQSIAHNTLVLNETSHFGGKYDLASLHHSDLHFYDDRRDDHYNAVQVVSAVEANAYPNAVLRRTMALIGSDMFEQPILLDIFKASSDTPQQYDLPFYYLGQLMQVSFDYDAPPSPIALGTDFGYQHLHLEAEGAADSQSSWISWMNHGGFYTLTSATHPSDRLLLARIGANDPEFNLRRDPVLIIRRTGIGNTLFATVIEPHGQYSPVSELAVNARSSIAGLEVVHDDESFAAVSITATDGRSSVFIVAHKNPSPLATHALKIRGVSYTWNGPYTYIEH